MRKSVPRLIDVLTIVAGILTLGVLVCTTPACAPKPPTAFPYEMAQTFQGTGASILDQAVWREILARLRGHVNNPGLRAGAGQEFYSYVRIENADGDILLEGNGDGTGTISPEARKVILELLDETSNSEVERLLNRMLDRFEPAPAPTSQPSDPG